MKSAKFQRVKYLTPFYVISFALTLSSCSHFLVKESYSGIYYTSIEHGSYEEYNSLIQSYEDTGELPDNNYHVGALYAGRSTTIVRHDPSFTGVRMCVRAIPEITSDENLYLGWIVPTLFLPISLVVDIVYLPIQSYNTMVVSQDDIQNALVDLKQARNLGYSKKTFSRGFFAHPAQHLDTIGYELDED